MRGIDEAAGGVDSANNNKRTKKATKIFIPEKRVFILIKQFEMRSERYIV
jgi:hypothetical protein